MKEELIKKYIMSIDFTNENWSISKIKEDMRSFLGEEPGIDVEWSKDAFLNEKSGEPEIIEKVKSLSIVFTETNDKFKKLNFILESPR
jgi:hypothetical protein